MHKQKWAKVNVPVDEGIKELVEALSEFPKLQTIESCEDVGNGTAWVCFWYGNHWKNSWEELAEFVLGYLGKELKKELGEDMNLSIQVNNGGLPQGELEVRQGAIIHTARLLRKLAT